MLVIIRTYRLLTKNGKRKALKILGTLKDLKTSPMEHVFKHIIFVKRLLQDLYFIEHKMTKEDMFKLLHETLGEQDMFLLENTWTVVRNYRGYKNLDSIVAYCRLVKSFIIVYKRMGNTRPNALSFARRMSKVTSNNKVR